MALPPMEADVSEFGKSIGDDIAYRRITVGSPDSSVPIALDVTQGRYLYTITLHLSYTPEKGDPLDMTFVVDPEMVVGPERG